VEASMIVWSRTEERMTQAGRAKPGDALMSNNSPFEPLLQREASPTSFSALAHASGARKQPFLAFRQRRPNMQIVDSFK
jgi:hypothetical protein